MLRETFSDEQKELMKMNVKRDDAVLLTNRNKILHCISLCKNRHGGPLTSVQEVVEMVKKYKGDDKGLNKSLNLEIRLCKLSFTKVKSTFPLLKQQNISIEEKIKNLTSLIKTQLEVKELADMTDLEMAIRGNSTNVIQNTNPDSSELSIQVGEFVVGVFTDGFYPG